MNRTENRFGETVHVVDLLAETLSMIGESVGAFSSGKAYHDVVESVNVSNLDTEEFFH